jgi:ribose transport system substrate-binding protein
MTNPKLALAAIATTLAFSVVGAAEPNKIYTLLPDTALSGVDDPHMPDRAAIRKAWPKKPTDPKNIKVGWAEMASSIPYFIEQDKSAQRTAKKYGMTIDFQSAEGDLQRQCSEIDTFVTRQVDVIVVNLTDTLGISRCINRAVDRGIPVVAVGTVPDPSARILTTISPNPYENGFGAGTYIGKSAEKGVPISVALITGVAGNSTAESRLNGMISGIAGERMKQLGLSSKREDAMLRGYELFQQVKRTGKFDDPRLKIKGVAMLEGKWTEEGGLAAAETILAAHGSDINYILCDNDIMALGALKALKNAGKQGAIRVAAPSDGFRIALDRVKNGDLLTDGTFSGEQTGAAVVEFLNQIFNQGLDANNLPMGSYFPVSTITKENVDQFIDPNKDNKFYKYSITPVKTIPQLRAEMAANAK